MIQPLYKKYFKEISAIHCDVLKGDFQVLLGEGFLERMYGMYQASEYGTGYVFIDGNKVVGFVLAAYDIEKFEQDVILKEGIAISFIALTRILTRPFIVPALLKQIFLNLNLKKIDYKSELVTIAVGESVRNKGIGQLLFQAIVDDFRKKGIFSLKLTTDARNEPASNFYRKLGFTIAYSSDQFGAKQNILVCFLTCSV